MKLNSKLFDSVRIKPRRAERSKPEENLCAWDGCDRPGEYKAPKGWRAAGEFHSFCLEHVRKYNQTFDYFDGADNDKIAEIMRKAAQTGERPTWGAGVNAKGKSRPRSGKVRDFTGSRMHDPHGVFARLARRKGAGDPQPQKRRQLAEPDRRAFETLGLDGVQPTEEIKKAYKVLVKKHHPDANGGDKASEERLRAIILAYTHLKQKGFV